MKENNNNKVKGQLKFIQGTTIVTPEATDRPQYSTISATPFFTGGKAVVDTKSIVNRNINLRHNRNIATALENSAPVFIETTAVKINPDGGVLRKDASGVNGNYVTNQIVDMQVIAAKAARNYLIAKQYTSLPIFDYTVTGGSKSSPMDILVLFAKASSYNAMLGIQLLRDFYQGISVLNNIVNYFPDLQGNITSLVSILQRRQIVTAIKSLNTILSKFAIDKTFISLMNKTSGYEKSSNGYNTPFTYIPLDMSMNALEYNAYTVYLRGTDQSLVLDDVLKQYQPIFSPSNILALINKTKTTISVDGVNIATDNENAYTQISQRFISRFNNLTTSLTGLLPHYENYFSALEVIGERVDSSLVSKANVGEVNFINTFNVSYESNFVNMLAAATFLPERVTEDNHAMVSMRIPSFYNYTTLSLFKNNSVLYCVSTGTYEPLVSLQSFGLSKAYVMNNHLTDANYMSGIYRTCEIDIMNSGNPSIPALTYAGSKATAAEQMIQSYMTSSLVYFMLNDHEYINEAFVGGLDAAYESISADILMDAARHVGLVK